MDANADNMAAWLLEEAAIERRRLVNSKDYNGGLAAGRAESAAEIKRLRGALGRLIDSASMLCCTTAAEADNRNAAIKRAVAALAKGQTP